jgi:hypothetical protein
MFFPILINRHHSVLLCYNHISVLPYSLSFLLVSNAKKILKHFSRVLQFNIQRIAFEVDRSVETLDEVKEALRRIISKSRWHTKSSILRHS